MGKPKESDLYAPVKALLESQGFDVKGEVGAADVMAVRGNEPPVIVELKSGFSLALFHQAVERLSITDLVYVAVPRGTGRSFLTSLRNNIKLCRRLGLGLICVRLKDGFSEIHLDPAPYQPRKSKPKEARMLREFARRVGDPNTGGINRQIIVTAYRQDAARIAAFLLENGPTKAASVAKITDIERARAILSADHYGWFERVDRGIYALTPKGKTEIAALDGI